MGYFYFLDPMILNQRVRFLHLDVTGAWDQIALCWGRQGDPPLAAQNAQKHPSPLPPDPSSPPPLRPADPPMSPDAHGAKPPQPRARLKVEE